MREAPHDEVIAIIDQSGSMAAIKSDAIGGFNEFLQSQEGHDKVMALTLTMFNSHVDFVHEATPLAAVAPLSDETYIPRGTTALYDAIGKTLAAVELRHNNTKKKYLPETVTVVILTDGEENASVEYGRTKIANWIEKLEAKGWTFVFLAANQDAFATGSSLNINAQTTEGFAYSGEGVRDAFRSATAYVSDARG